MNSTAFRLDHGYDRDRADPDTRSRYGNYLNQHRATFEEIVSFGYEDPSVDFATATWRIANGPIMAPPFVRSPRRVLSAAVQRSEWNGEAIIDVDLIANRPEKLAYATTTAGAYYRDWPTDFHGDYTGIGDRDLVTSPYLLHRAQVLIQIPPGTLPRITEVPTKGDLLLNQAYECLQVLIGVLNREIGPLIEQMDGTRD